MPKGLPSFTTPSSFDLYEGIAYQEYWTTADTRKFHILEDAIVRELLPLRGNCLIDLGCGYGRLASCYIDRFKHTVMFDGSRSLLKSAQKMTDGKSWYIWGDINHLPFHPAVFDCVLMVRAFQHIADSYRCIQGISKIVCQGGHFIFNYSNKRNPYRVLRYLLGRTPQNPFTLKPLMEEANFFHHHPEYISSLLAASGFKILAFRGAGVFNKIVEISGPLANLVPTGKSFAPLLGKLGLAPWIFCQTLANKNDALQFLGDIESLLVCPCCDSDLIQSLRYFECRHCRKKYAVEGGIIDMRFDPKL